VPCFVNAPLRPCRRRGDEDKGERGFTAHLGWLGQWRCCTRVGNFTVLLERLPQKSKDDEEAPGGGSGGSGEEGGGKGGGGGGGERRAAPRRELWLVMGPYWPFCLVLTTSLVVSIPAGLALLLWGVYGPHTWVLQTLLALAGITLMALALVACRDPGILPHYGEEPRESVAAREAAAAAAAARGNGRYRPSRGDQWVYNDQMAAWRPRGAVYDHDVNACVLGFDHVCPFTGTAIGRNNLCAFYVFTGGVQVLIWFAIGVGFYGVYRIAKYGYSPPF
jgi:hypothetical protein